MRFTILGSLELGGGNIGEANPLMLVPAAEQGDLALTQWAIAIVKDFDIVLKPLVWWSCVGHCCFLAVLTQKQRPIVRIQY